jgi:hypothetical protein
MTGTRRSTKWGMACQYRRFVGPRPPHRHRLLLGNRTAFVRSSADRVALDGPSINGSWRFTCGKSPATAGGLSDNNWPVTASGRTENPWPWAASLEGGGLRLKKGIASLRQVLALCKWPIDHGIRAGVACSKSVFSGGCAHSGPARDPPLLGLPS